MVLQGKMLLQDQKTANKTNVSNIHTAARYDTRECCTCVCVCVRWKTLTNNTPLNKSCADMQTAQNECVKIDLCNNTHSCCLHVCMDVSLWITMKIMMMTWLSHPLMSERPSLEPSRTRCWSRRPGLDQHPPPAGPSPHWHTHTVINNMNTVNIQITLHWFNCFLSSIRLILNCLSIYDPIHNSSSWVHTVMWIFRDQVNLFFSH